MANPTTTASDGCVFRFGLEIADPAAMPADIAELGRTLAGFLAGRGVHGEDANALDVALEELLTNLGKFGGTARVEGAVTVADADVSLAISDNGPEFDPTRWPPPDLDPEAMLSRPVGGLGLHLLFQLFNDVAYRREDDRNITVWRRRRSPPIM